MKKKGIVKEKKLKGGIKHLNTERRKIKEINEKMKKNDLKKIEQKKTNKIERKSKRNKKKGK